MNFSKITAPLERVKKNRVVARVLEINGRFGDDGGGYLAASLSYYAFFSIFPLLLLGASVAGFVLAGDAAGQARLASKLAGSIPGLGSLMGRNISTIVAHRGATGVVGLLGALWSGTGLVRAAGYALAKINRTKDPGNYFETQAWAIGSTIGLGLLVVLTTALSASVLKLNVHGPAKAGIVVAGIVVSLILDLTLFVACYKVLHRGPSSPVKRIWRGAVLPAIGWTVLKFAGSWYASRTVKGSTAVFGAFASVVGIMVILYLISRLFIFGAEINAVFDPAVPTDRSVDGRVRAA